MNKETSYAVVAGCAAFILIAYGTFWYFSRDLRTAELETTGTPASSREVGEVPAARKQPPPVVGRSGSTDNALPLIRLQPAPSATVAPVAAPQPALSDAEPVGSSGSSPTEVKSWKDRKPRGARSWNKDPRAGTNRRSLHLEKRLRRALPDDD